MTNVTFVVAKLKKNFSVTFATLSAAVSSPAKALCTFLSISLSEGKENPKEVSSKFYCNSVAEQLECFTERTLLEVNEFDQLYHTYMLANFSLNPTFCFILCSFSMSLFRTWKSGAISIFGHCNEFYQSHCF